MINPDYGEPEASRLRPRCKCLRILKKAEKLREKKGVYCNHTEIMQAAGIVSGGEF